MAVGGLLLFVSGFGAGFFTKTDRDDKPTTTVAASSTTTRPTASTASTASTTTAPPHVPTPADFTIEIIELERSCFGSAGCNIVYRINPSYIGPPVSGADSKTYTVIYEVQGGDSPKTANFKITKTEARFSEQDNISTPPNPTLTAVPVRVIES